MKKIFLSIFLLISILTYSKGDIEEITAPKPIRSSKEKTPLIAINGVWESHIILFDCDISLYLVIYYNFFNLKSQ